MQGRCLLLSQDGWVAGKVLRELKSRQGRKLKETPDLVLQGKSKYKGELLRTGAAGGIAFFANEQSSIDALQATAADEANQHLESYLEEQGGEGGAGTQLTTRARSTASQPQGAAQAASDAEEKAAKPPSSCSKPKAVPKGGKEAQESAGSGGGCPIPLS